MIHRRPTSLPALIIWVVLATFPTTMAMADAPIQPPSNAHASGFHVPEGFTVERVAGPPLVDFPMMAVFDERGRLFVTENAGVNLDFKQLERDPPSKILLLEDTDGDGAFDKRTVFADKLTFPSGVLWHDGALFVTSPPGLWRLEDTDDDGVADGRKQIVTGFASVGNAADLHGPFLGPDGWLYFSDGRNGHNVTLGDGTPWKGKAACVYRCRPDGSGLEVVFGGGFDNPVEAVFTPAGELLINVNILHAKPHRVDAIVYGIDGANYPYADVWKELKRTGDFLPSAGNLGWVATSGFMRYRGTADGDPHRGRYFSTTFNTRTVQVHDVARDGAGFRVTHADFLTSDHPDFRPTDVLEDADGSLLVIDTGGWFRIGCPNSQIAKPEVRGAIYRIRRAGARLGDLRGRGIAWDDLSAAALAALLQDGSPAVRDRAVARLRAMESDQAVVALSAAVREVDGDGAVEALWGLVALNSAAARTAVREALAAERIDLRIAAAHALGSVGDQQGIPALLSRLSNEASPPVRRAAATALGRLRASDSVAALLSRAGRSGDRFEEHAMLYALIQIADRGATMAGTRDKNPSVRRAALIALDQMAGGALGADLIVPHLASDHAALRHTALSIAVAHPEWAAQVVAPLRRALAREAVSKEDGDALAGAVAAFAQQAPVQTLIAEVLASAETSQAASRLLVLRSIAEAGVTPLPETWLEPIQRSLADPDARIIEQAIEVIRRARSDQFDEHLQRVAADASHSTPLRVAALATVLPRIKSVSAEQFQLLVQQLEPDVAALARLAAAQALSAAPLDDAQLVSLAGALEEAGPLELPVLLLAFERSASADVGSAVIRTLRHSKSAAGLTQDNLVRVLAPYPPSVRAAAAPLIEKLNVGKAAQATRLAELAPLLAGGDPSRGQSVFFAGQSACATCHTVRGTGGSVGPDLSKIASIRSARDLLESIVFPSASFARGYEPIVVETTSNEVYAGTMVRESADSIVLRTPAEVRLQRSAVRSIRRDRVSTMPQGLESQLSQRDLADLLAFLQSLK